MFNFTLVCAFIYPEKIKHGMVLLWVGHGYIFTGDAVQKLLCIMLKGMRL
jgi:hypothetical protein